MSLNMEQARFNMIEQQIRTWDVLDSAVLDVLGTVPREDFVPSRHRRMAFADLRIPLAMQQVMMKPIEEGRMLQALALEPGQSVLEIGTGSGFTASCLAALGGQVLSVDIHAELADTAAARLERLGIAGVEIRRGDALSDQFDPGGTFDRVVVTGSVAKAPERFLDWVSPGGRLFLVRGFSPAMEAVCLHRNEHNAWAIDSLFETDLPRLVGAEDRPLFQF
ncbi:MAG: protein-L-isoaspartate O-methyltransferase [Wenzhouxiangella sp.]|jgi:protein-L-isoaspartate(D-aspartate) O-methyltransferase|nr:protein-L-isoaspartate O-methyltransferase [Wenzhouxiangella sp.]